MKTKTFSLLSLSILALVIFANLASAVTFSNINLVSKPTSVDQDAGSFNIVFNVTNLDSIPGTLDFSNSTVTSGATIVFNDTSVAADATEGIIATITFPINITSPISGIINLTNNAVNPTLDFNVPVNKTIPDEIKTCFTTDDRGGDLEIEIRDINVINGFGDDDNFWYPLDEVEIEIKVSNNADERIDDIEVRWGLYDVDDNNFVFDEKESDFNLKKGDDKTITITFKLENVDDFKGSNYVFYVWTDNAETQDTNIHLCASDSKKEIDIINDDNFVRLYDINFPEVVSCGEEVQILADVVNLGDTNQDEVSVLISNTQLGISKVVEIGDINDFDSEKLDTFITIPSNAENKVYFISLKVYDDNNDIYETDEDNDKSEFSVSLRVEGCKTASKASVTASLESGGKAGEDLVVKAIVINTGDKSATYSISAAGYSEWASSVGISQQTFTLDKGSSKDVAFTFKVKDDVSGDKSFDIELISGNELIVKQPVQVTIEGKTGGFLTGFTTFSGNGYLWVIGALNVILIFAIIIVAIKVARR